ncbi:MAG: LPP20 family lipoprotein [Campylobacterota bacterium]|nr:LPP20 family lipoprotein [Campylobacterota bacterium]
MKYLSKKTIISTIAASLLFSGCVGGLMPQKQQKAKTPMWYIDAPSNNNNFIYGEGKATTVKEAKNNALNAMASRLVVSVGSSMKTVTKTSRTDTSSSYSKDIQKDLQVDVQKIKFTNAKVEKSDQVGDNFYILMKVNREILFNNKKKDFDIIDKSVTSKFDSLKNYGKLEQIHILQEIYPKIRDAKKQAVVLNALNNSFDHGSYVKRYDIYIDQIYNLKNDSTIEVRTNSKDRYFADGLIDMLNQQQYKISNNDNSDILIKINNKIKYSIARGWNIAKVATTLSVLSNNKIVSNRTITSVGRSSTSKESALENASTSFLKSIKKESLDKVIFSK